MTGCHNRAAIEAGFRLRTISVPLDPQRAAQTIHRHFNAAQFREFARVVAAIAGLPATT
jgi:hypothetical protein